MIEWLIQLVGLTSNIPKVSKAHERSLSTHTSSSPTSLSTFVDSWNQPTLLSLSAPSDTNTDQKKKKNHISAKAPVLSAPGAEILVFSISTKFVLLTLCCTSTQNMSLGSRLLCSSSHWMTDLSYQPLSSCLLRILIPPLPQYYFSCLI